MKNTLNFVKRRKVYFLVGVPVLLLVAYFAFGREEKGAEAYIAGNADIVQSVALSGKIETSDKADLGFAASGRLSRIFIKNNQSVSQGQTLAQLEIGDLLADLKIKQLGSKTSNVDLEDAKKEVEKVTVQENTKVESTYRTLLTEDLVLIPNSSTYEVGPPTISGIYKGREGRYKITIDQENVTSSKFQLKIFELQKSEREINQEGPTLLGTKGLYISFPHDLEEYKDTTWYLEIPNKASSSYLANFNSYNEAKDARDIAIKNAEFDYQKLLTSDDGGSSVAQAEIQKINAEIRKNTIYAPFAGQVTNIEKEVGENASVGERVISILGKEKLEVVLQVSELDVSKLVSGSAITISIDSLPGEEFSGILKTVNSRETEIDGVPVYEAFVEIKPDPRIKTGMSASGIIILAEKKNVLAIPSYLIKKVGNSNFVSVGQEDGTTIEKEVTLGLTGTDSMVEVTSGLDLGDRIVSGEAKK